jgi:hypothetical protein
MGPVGDMPSPRADSRKEHREGPCGVAFRVPETGPEVRETRGLGLEGGRLGQLAGGQSPGTFRCVRDPKQGIIIVESI